LPEGIPVHGATGIQYQFPNEVPAISSTATMTQIAAKSGQRGERSRNTARTGRHIRPWTSTRPVSCGRTVTPASDQAVAAARTK